LNQVMCALCIWCPSSLFAALTTTMTRQWMMFQASTSTSTSRWDDLISCYFQHYYCVFIMYIHQMMW
jgi:hypothetical protein